MPHHLIIDEMIMFSSLHEKPRNIRNKPIITAVINEWVQVMYHCGYDILSFLPVGLPSVVLQSLIIVKITWNTLLAARRFTRVSIINTCVGNQISAFL